MVQPEAMGTVNVYTLVHYPHCNPLWKISWEVWIEDLDIIRVLDLVDVTAKLFELLPKPGCHHCQSLVAKYQNEDAVPPVL